MVKGGDLNGFTDIQNFQDWLGLGMPLDHPSSLGFQISLQNYIEDIYFFEVNTKYISSSVLKTSGANFINKVRKTYLKLCVRCFLRSAYVSFIKTS